MIEDIAQKVAKAFNSLGFAEVVQVTFKSDQLGFLCRFSEEADALKLIYHLFLKEESWQSHICKKFFLKGPDMRFAWNFSFKADDITAAGEKICRILNLFRDQYLKEDQTHSEDGIFIETVPYLASPDRNKKVRGKGAVGFGSKQP